MDDTTTTTSTATTTTDTTTSTTSTTLTLDYNNQLDQLFSTDTEINSFISLLDNPSNTISQLLSSEEILNLNSDDLLSESLLNDLLLKEKDIHPIFSIGSKYIENQVYCLEYSSNISMNKPTTNPKKCNVILFNLEDSKKKSYVISSYHNNNQSLHSMIIYMLENTSLITFQIPCSMISPKDELFKLILNNLKLPTIDFHVKYQQFIMLLTLVEINTLPNRFKTEEYNNELYRLKLTNNRLYISIEFKRNNIESVKLLDKLILFDENSKSKGLDKKKFNKIKTPIHKKSRVKESKVNRMIRLKKLDCYNSEKQLRLTDYFKKE